MNVSVYSTVLNEESSIKSLLDSLLSQSREPDEIIIVDGGSTDRTVAIIRNYMRKGASIKLIVAKGANVAQGRNIGVKSTKYDVVASIDAGCIADNEWFKKLIEKFDEEVDIVTGVCLPDARNKFEQCFAELLYPKANEFKADWPSHQNMAFRKEVWAKSKYPESCYRSEDTWFNINAREKGFKFRLAKDAIVYWRPRKNLREVFKNSYLWTKSNIENDVRAQETTKIALNCLLKLAWRLLSILMLLFVFIFISRVGAVLLAPFIVKDVINLYWQDKSISKTICKNLISYTDMLAQSFGLIVGKIAKRKRIKKN